jgi:hypothetical protein
LVLESQRPSAKAKLGSDTPLFSYFLVGRINRGDFLGSERHKFCRHATRNHPVGLILKHQLVIVMLQPVIIDVRRYPQNLVRVDFNGTHVARFEVVELRRGKPKA